MTNKPEMVLYFSDTRGQYIPRDFAESFSRDDEHVSGVTEKEFAILEAGPDHEFYWDTWDDVLNNAVLTSDAGVTYTLYQDGDLWLVPIGMEWNDKEDTFKWPNAAAT